MTPAELTVVTHAALAFVLAWAIGYERFYNGRAAGTQVYCLVCTASCALTSAAGLAGNWFGTRQLADATGSTQVIASLLTGIGFLGAGIIVKSGASVRGLTTAASIWSSAAIGILVGVNFAVAAVGLTAIFIVCMAAVPGLERHFARQSRNRGQAPLPRGRAAAHGQDYGVSWRAQFGAAFGFSIRNLRRGTI
jgi:putative Mg2+ transporter-C (MgtC) family protein